jgi:V8-like Glu-specific endopeptidase
MVASWALGGAGRAPAAWPATATPPAVGVLLQASGGRLGPHFCTASVVRSPGKDLVITAAHCVSRYLGTSRPELAFAPGYRDGTAPLGVWQVTRIIVDPAWASSADPDDDVALLVVQQAGGDAPVEDVTGAERLGIGWSSADRVTVIGYPRTQNLPLTCQNRASSFTARQMRIDCGSFSDGTSGGPFLAGVDARTGEGTVIGVVGGYQQGGSTPDVSYSITFGQQVQILYRSAVTES